jgi:uncharacterized protein YjiS (DUF1127 family)
LDFLTNVVLLLKTCRGRAGKTAANPPFTLMISSLSYAHLTLLQRNIVAFPAAPRPYFAGNEIHRPRRPTRGFAMFASFVRAIRAWKRYHQSVNELNRLGDRELADIGISRSDIPRVAWSASQKA